jgi:uncharacterized membrane protein YhaH (DUF805 family)
MNWMIVRILLGVVLLVTDIGICVNVWSDNGVSPWLKLLAVTATVMSAVVAGGLQVTPHRRTYDISGWLFIPAIVASSFAFFLTNPF